MFGCVLCQVWKGEAFRLWVDLWASLYDDESKSAELLHDIHDSYYLVAVVDNNFIDGNLWEVQITLAAAVVGPVLAASYVVFLRETGCYYDHLATAGMARCGGATRCCGSNSRYLATQGVAKLPPTLLMLLLTPFPSAIVIVLVSGSVHPRGSWGNCCNPAKERGAIFFTPEMAAA